MTTATFGQTKLQIYQVSCLGLCPSTVSFANWFHEWLKKQGPIQSVSGTVSPIDLQTVLGTSVFPIALQTVLGDPLIVDNADILCRTFGENNPSPV